LLETSDDFNVAGNNIFADASILTAIDPNGNALAIWQQSDGVPDGSTLKTYSRRYVAGQGWQPAVVIAGVNATTSPANGFLLMDGAGNATWIRSNGETRRYSPTTGWAAPFFVPALNTGIITSAVIDAAGNIGVLASGSDVSNNALPPTGSWGSWVQVDASGALSARDARVALSSNGTAIAVWRQQNPGDSFYSVFAARYTPTTGWGTPGAIENVFTDANSNGTPRVAIDAAGNAVAIWSQGSSIYANQFNATSGTWGTAAVLDGGQSSTFSARLNLVMTPDGRAVAVWNTGFGSRSSQYSAASGWSAAVDVSPYSIELSLGIDNAGNAVMIYKAPDQWPNPTSGTQDLYSRRLTFGGAWSNRALIETGVGDIKGNIVFGMNAAGQAVAVWAQDDLPNNQVRNSLWGAVLR
jgi:hypothetical protein